MKIIAVDDEEASLDELVYEIRAALKKLSCNDEYLKEQDTTVIAFRDACEALEYVKNNSCDVAFLDIDMPEITGIDLAKRMKKSLPDINVIFETGYGEYGVPACQIRASGYILKPVTEAAIIEEFKNLRHSVDIENKGIKAVTFGDFEILSNGRQVKFKRGKSKEMLAYLIDKHGKAAQKKEIAIVLFEDHVYDQNIQDYMKKIIADLKESLMEAGAGKILKCGYNSYSVDIDSFVCDLYEYEKGSSMALNSFHGKYMNQYSWAEETLGRLTINDIT